VKNGFSSGLIWARKIGYFWTPSLCAAAAEYKQLDALKILRANGCDWDEETCTNAAANGNLEMLKWAREAGCRWSTETCHAAAACGQIECLKYARENKCNWETTTNVFIHLDLIKYLVENRLAFSVPDVYVRAAKEGNLEVVKYLHEQGHQLPFRLMASAAESGNIKLVEWIFFRDPTLNFQFVESAKGNLEMVKYLVEILGVNGTCDAAARCGSLEVIQYLHEEKGVQLLPHTLTYAVKNGHLEVVKYLMERNAPEDINMFFSAASSGNVDLLKFVHERGHRWLGEYHSNIYTAAISANSVACMKYAFENGCPVPAVDSHVICRAAVENNALGCLKYAREIGCDWNSGDTFTGLCYIAMTYGYFEVFKYLHENGCSLNKDFCSQAARSGQLEFLRYARNFVRWDDSVCVAAAQNIHATCLKYAHDSGLKLTPDVIREAITCSSLHCLKYAVENGCDWPCDVWELAGESESILVYVYLTAHCPIKPTKSKKKARKLTQAAE
jgi:hypothetical protein